MRKGVTVLVVDGGGRGAVLVDKYLRSPHVGQVLAIPGNDLMAEGLPAEREETKKLVLTFPPLKTTDIDDITKICSKYKVDLVDVAQDNAVAAGVTDHLVKRGIKVFGPKRAAGQIEWDKAWARNFMKDFGIPSPKFKICSSPNEGAGFIKSQKEGQWFVKASGLAAGKGALYAETNKEVLEKIGEMKYFGRSGETFLIEECLYGEEFSSFAIVDGRDFVIIGHAQDHKQVYDGDLGPNTGGMGCSSPPVIITRKIEVQIKSIFKKASQGLAQLKRPYQGILYLGGMINNNGKVHVLEFNARWGDPEAQVIAPGIKNDFYELANDILEGRIQKVKIKKDNFYRVAVTAAARGYPEDYSQVIGKEIFGLREIKNSKNIKLFGAAVKKSDGRYFVGGGRLFYVIGQGKNIAQARQSAYNALSLAYVEGNNLHFRTDIGYRDLERFNAKKGVR